MSSDQATLGCDLDDLRAIVAGVIDYPVSPCNSWRTCWAGKLPSYHPEVVGLLIGRWDITDHLDNGTVVHIGQPAWDAHLDARDRSGGRTCSSSTGAKVVLFTMPDHRCLAPSPDGAPDAG